MKCVECCAPVSYLYTKFGRGNQNIRLAQCDNCKKFADKYIELDFVLLSIDVILMKPQVYRHLLFNSLNSRNFRNVLNFAFLVILFDVFLIWSRLETRATQFPLSVTKESFVSRPIALQYLFLLFLCISETIVYHLALLLLLRLCLGWRLFQSACGAVIMSSSTKMLPVFMVIWDYDVPAAAMVVEWVVLLSNTEALSILLENVSFFRIGLLVFFASLCRSVFVYGLLHVLTFLPLQPPAHCMSLGPHLSFLCKLVHSVTLTTQTAV
ncbi:Arv1-like family protein [Schizosaccharomyces japonicus yFS275]|uniref:Protein ARV n=1 Tax=Schizosaccharomyces japonicus (strain yFS275 / FY16936) TaxID=402676 RepID=B6JV59_SCHJY|nr:Arv1-like family protein [Schizosaccharomyces japonicus yFS275]EEB05260.2 Arv1-like family protein [Schizosaccharomyces japonicus yFS275]